MLEITLLVISFLSELKLICLHTSITVFSTKFIAI